MSRKCWDERPPWSDSLSAARVLVMWKGRVPGTMENGEALERRAVLVRKDMMGIQFSGPWVSMRQRERYT